MSSENLEVLKGALRDEQYPTGEPFMNITDVDILTRIEKACSAPIIDKEGKMLINSRTGEPITQILPHYAPILNHAKLSLSYQESLFNYDEKRCVRAECMYNHRLRKLRSRYQGDNYALSLLDEIAASKRNGIWGNARNGHKAEHIQRIMGGIKSLLLGNMSETKKSRPWWLK